ncbi:hypothetical protein PG995_005328 [Apiospora arundinis]
MPLFSLNSPSNRPEVDIEGSMTNPRDKRCRKSLRPWQDFPEEQEPGTLYDTFPTESRVFEDRNVPAGLGNRTRREDPQPRRLWRGNLQRHHLGHETTDAISTSYDRIRRRNAVLQPMLRTSAAMLSGSYCEYRGLSISEVPSADSARWDRSARHNQAQCDVQCLTSVQPRTIGAKYSKV